MNANRIFNDLLKCIENSNLNYSLIKTPFSATINLKSSFIKRFGNSGENKVNSEPKLKSVNEENLEAEIMKLKENVKKLEKEVSEQNAYIDTLVKVTSEKDILEKLYSEEKDKQIALEREMENCKLEFLNKINSAKEQIESLVNQNDDLKDDAKRLKIDYLDLKEILQEKVETIKKMNEAKFNDVKELSQRIYSCHLCDYDDESGELLKKHVQSFHYSDRGIQCQEPPQRNIPFFNAYPCYYCAKMIESVEGVLEHKCECESEPPLLFPCDQVQPSKMKI